MLLTELSLGIEDEMNGPELLLFQNSIKNEWWRMIRNF